MASLVDRFFQTTSANPQLRRQAETDLCENINRNPGSALDILRFATDWGNQEELDHNNNNSANTNIIWSRLAAAIFLKNMILHSPWGSGAIYQLTPQQVQEKYQELMNNNNNGGPLSPSQMFGNFLPPPELQNEIRTQLIIAMVNWKSTSNNNNNNSNARITNVEETILRYIQNAVEAIHDIDWPRNWTNLFEQAVDDFTSNSLPACQEILQNFSSSSSNNNFFSQSSPDAISRLTNALNRGAASLCVIKLCCKRLFDPEASDGVLGNSIAATISKNRGGNGNNNNTKTSSYKNEASEELLRLAKELLQPLGERVLVPFIQITNDSNWSRLMIHCSEFSSHPQNANNNDALLLLSNFERAWTTFCYEGLKGIFHLSQTQVYGALLDAKLSNGQPFLFALVQSCCKLHHALTARLLKRREGTILENNNNNNNNNSLLPENLFFQLNDKREAQVWRLWKRIWAVLFHLFDHYAEQQAVPKSIRKTHRDWITAQFVPALGCAVGMVVLHENRPTWTVSKYLNNASDFSYSALNAACDDPGRYSIDVIFSSFIRSCADEASSFCNNNQQQQLDLLLCPFIGAPTRAESDAANYTADVLEMSLKYLPWIWWENVLVSKEMLFENMLLLSQNRFPPAIAPLFVASESGFTETTGVLAWVLINWVILPRQAITIEEIEEWEINPTEYLNSKNDASTELYNLKSSYSRVLSALLTAKEGNNNTATKKNNNNKRGKKNNNNNNDSSSSVSIAKLRVQFLVDTAFNVLAKSSNEIFSSGIQELDILNPHPAVLAADAALQIVRLCRHAVMERGNNKNQQQPNVVESGLMMQGLLPLLSSKKLRFGPLRAKAAQVASELCAGIQWSGEDAFQTVLKGVLDLMYDEDIAVRMQVCSSLSPLIRHRLAGTVVVPHLGKIVQQFFDVLAQNQNEIVIRTLRKLFAHYREHMGRWAVDLAKIILERFQKIVGQIMELENEDSSSTNNNNNHPSRNNNNNSEYGHAAGGGAGGRHHSSSQKEQDQFEREVADLTTIGDELLSAISTIVKCVPRPSSVSVGNNNSSDEQQQQQRVRNDITNTACALQDLLSPMLQNMFDSPNSLGFFELGLQLLSVLLRRSEDRVLPVTWNIFSSLFRFVTVRSATDCFANMISVLDNFVSADPLSFMALRQQVNNPEQQQFISQHPAESATFAVQAHEMLKSVCETATLPIQDVCNAIQCIDCYVLNGSRCIQTSIVARYAPQHTIIKALTFDQICEKAQSNDPLRLGEFLELPIILTRARQNRVPEEAARMQLPATPSLCVLLANSVFCCVIAATPQAVCTENVLLQRALLSFTMTSRLFDAFNGVGSGEFKRVSELAQQPLHFRVYDRKLFILAVSHFISSLTDEHNSGSSQQQAFFQMMEQEGYGNNENQHISTIEGFIKTALMMAMENAYVDCRLLQALRNDNGDDNNQNEFFKNNQGGGGGYSDDDDNDELFSDDDDSDEDGEFGGASDDDTDCTTDEDFLEGIYDDDGDNDDDDDDWVGDEDDDDNNNNFDGGNQGGVSKHSYINQIASEAARMREQEENDLEEDDFHDNLLVEDPNMKVTTPIDDIDEFRVLGEVLESINQRRNGNNNNNNGILNLVSSAIGRLTQDFGGLPVCRDKMMNTAGGSTKKSRKKKLQQQQSNNDQQQQRRELTFALASFYTKNPPSNQPLPTLPPLEFLKQCSQQKSAIENIE